MEYAQVKTKLWFFIGKGGVGKTTMAAAFALINARKNLKTLIVSLDPAHNLGDVYDMELGDESKEIMENLWGIEVDYDKMVKSHLKTLSDKIKDIYGYLRIFNLEKYVDVLRHSPGIEEQAALEKIVDIIKEYGVRKKFDVIVFDTPPTGLMLRIMALPTISLIWIDKLIKLRIAILERRKIIASITNEPQEMSFGEKKIKLAVEPSEDPIYNELVMLKREYSFINKLLTSQTNTSVAIVVNPEILPILEAKRAYDFLVKLGIPVRYLIVNKYLEIQQVVEEIKPRLEEQEKALSKARELFKDLVLIKVPYMYKEPRGLNELEVIAKYLRESIK